MNTLIERPATIRFTAIASGVIVVAWAAAVIVSAQTGLLGRLWMPSIAALVAAGIAIPTALYLTVASVRALASAIGLRAITAFHVWRIPAAILFFWFGLQGELPPAFWILAGVGDFIAGAWALRVALRANADLADYRAMHRFGFADFVVAVGTGLTFTLLLDPRMAPIAQLPLALIPLFGVGLSGATHIIAFDLIRRGNLAIKESM
ncbi:MAG: permease [Rhizobiales bacterium]|nr:permease [Hyphomicrobiales bacterium]